MFSKIQNPETGKWVNVRGAVGKRILQNYMQFGGAGAGGASARPFPGQRRSLTGLFPPERPPRYFAGGPPLMPMGGMVRSRCTSEIEPLRAVEQASITNELITNLFPEYQRALSIRDAGTARNAIRDRIMGLLQSQIGLYIHPKDVRAGLNTVVDSGLKLRLENIVRETCRCPRYQPISECVFKSLQDLGLDLESIYFILEHAANGGAAISPQQLSYLEEYLYPQAVPVAEEAVPDAAMCIGCGAAAAAPPPAPPLSQADVQKAARKAARKEARKEARKAARKEAKKTLAYRKSRQRYR